VHTDPPAIKKINLTIEPGERVGILGATGAGKTALVNLCRASTT
jgi:ABC-type multidrug transport system fused ATPase/permease subunit